VLLLSTCKPYTEDWRLVCRLMRVTRSAVSDVSIINSGELEIFPNRGSCDSVLIGFSLVSMAWLYRQNFLPND
jgi:hypothetical protein